jgi:hypothetical protein
VTRSARPHCGGDDAFVDHGEWHPRRCWRQPASRSVLGLRPLGSAAFTNKRPRTDREAPDFSQESANHAGRDPRPLLRELELPRLRPQPDHGDDRTLEHRLSRARPQPATGSRLTPFRTASLRMSRPAAGAHSADRRLRVVPAHAPGGVPAAMRCSRRVPAPA